LRAFSGRLWNPKAGSSVFFATERGTIRSSRTIRISPSPNFSISPIVGSLPDFRPLPIAPLEGGGADNDGADGGSGGGGMSSDTASFLAASFFSSILAASFFSSDGVVVVDGAVVGAGVGNAGVHSIESILVGSFRLNARTFTNRMFSAGISAMGVEEEEGGGGGGSSVAVEGAVVEEVEDVDDEDEVDEVDEEDEEDEVDEVDLALLSLAARSRTNDDRNARPCSTVYVRSSAS